MAQPSYAYRSETVIVGGGLGGLVVALELLESGRRVILIEQGSGDALGGLAAQSFGGLHLVDTPQQRRMRIRDSAALALHDWHSFAEFGPDDHWPRRWAEHYVTRCVPDIQEWLRHHGVSCFPAVQWAERGWYQPGNSVPRYHVIWGTGQHLAHTMVRRLREHPQRERLQLLYGHSVRELTVQGGYVVGCTGEKTGTHEPFTVQAEHVVVASGGITGNLERVRAEWPKEWGSAPAVMLNGSHPPADGRMHDAVAALGGRVTHLDKMWNYAAGVHHTRPKFPGHGLSLIPCRSALWLDHNGRRIGPEPLITGFDTRHLVERVSQLPKPWTWQVLNRRIALKELAVSGADHNPELRDRRLLPFLVRMLGGADALLDEMLTHCEDFVSAPTLAELVEKMNWLAESGDVDAAVLEQEIRRYDDRIARGRKYRNDDQLRRIAHLRGWFGDRVRTCNFQRILDPGAGPLIAIREFVITRKTLGGVQTDLQSRVLDTVGRPIAGLYAVGEASGFGGGGSSGKRSMEGTCLTGCILTARAAARAIVSGSATLDVARPSTQQYPTARAIA